MPVETSTAFFQALLVLISGLTGTWAWREGLLWVNGQANAKRPDDSLVSILGWLVIVTVTFLAGTAAVIHAAKTGLVAVSGSILRPLLYLYLAAPAVGFGAIGTSLWTSRVAIHSAPTRAALRTTPRRGPLVPTVLADTPEPGRLRPPLDTASLMPGKGTVQVDR